MSGVRSWTGREFHGRVRSRGCRSSVAITAEQGLQNCWVLSVRPSVCLSVCPIVRPAGLLWARLAGDRLLHGRHSAAAAPRHGAQQQMRAVPRCQPTYEAERRLVYSVKYGCFSSLQKLRWRIIQLLCSVAVESSVLACVQSSTCYSLLSHTHPCSYFGLDFWSNSGLLRK